MVSFGPSWGIDNMKLESSPEDWKAPEWHEDFGDPRIELEHLRSLAIAIRNSVPGVSLCLETLEPGLLELRVGLPNNANVEVHSIAKSHFAGERRFAIFVLSERMNENEYYTDSVAGALHFIGERSINIS